MTEVVRSTGFVHLHILRTNLTTSKSNGTKTRIFFTADRLTYWPLSIMRRVVCRIDKRIERSYRSHGTTAINIVNDVTTVNQHVSITEHDTCQEVERIIMSIIIRIILVSTTATPIHITSVGIARTFVGQTRIFVSDGRPRFYAYRSTMHIDIRIVEGMTILTTSIDRTLNQRIRQVRCLTLCSYRHISIVSPCQTVVRIHSFVARFGNIAS